MRKRIFNIIEVANDNDKISNIYDLIMMSIIIISMVPLMTKQTGYIYNLIDKASCTVFILDYILRISTADFKIKGKYPFFKYPFTPMALIDLISILPSITFIGSGFKMARILRLGRTFRVFRVFKSFRYSKNLLLTFTVLKKQKEALIAVGTFAVGYIIVSALIVFNVEPDTFNTFFDAIYWATVSLTTVGYGDIYPVTNFGRIVTMISSIFGIAIIALPAGIITAGYMEEINKK